MKRIENVTGPHSKIIDLYPDRQAETIPFLVELPKPLFIIFTLSLNFI